ncbi:MAG: GspE/PulE/PilB domain-containing protein [Planctomycetota bacterium]|jgi:hypothetical protein
MSRLSRLTRKRLGELLLEEQLISSDDLNDALRDQEVSGGVLGEILVSKGSINEDDVARVIAKQYGLPFIDPVQYEIPDEVKELFPEAALLKYRFVPLDVFGDLLLVVVGGIVEENVVNDIEEISNKKAHIMISTLSSIREVQLEAFHSESEELTGLGSFLLGEEGEAGGGDDLNGDKDNG